MLESSQRSNSRLFGTASMNLVQHFRTRCNLRELGDGPGNQSCLYCVFSFACHSTFYSVLADFEWLLALPGRHNLLFRAFLDVYRQFHSPGSLATAMEFSVLLRNATNSGALARHVLPPHLALRHFAFLAGVCPPDDLSSASLWPGCIFADQIIWLGTLCSNHGWSGLWFDRLHVLLANQSHNRFDRSLVSLMSLVVLLHRPGKGTDCLNVRFRPERVHAHCRRKTGAVAAFAFSYIDLLFHRQLA